MANVPIITQLVLSKVVLNGKVAQVKYLDPKQYLQSRDENPQHIHIQGLFGLQKIFLAIGVHHISFNQILFYFKKSSAFSNVK